MISPETKAQSKTFGLIENVAPNFFDFLGKQIPVCKGLLQDISAYYNQIRFPEIFSLSDTATRQLRFIYIQLAALFAAA